MNEHLDEKDVLARVLRDRADDVSGHPVSFHAVRGSARHLRRRRTVLAGTLAASLAAVGLPAGVAVTAAMHGDTDQDRSVVAESPGRRTGPDTSPDASPVPELRDGRVLLTLEDLPRGEDPRIDHVNGHRLVLAGGGAVTLPREYQAIVPTEAGWVGLAQDEGDYTRDLIDEGGSVTGSVPSTWGLATDLTGDRVAYVEVRDGRWSLVDVGADGTGARSPENPDNRPLRPVGYVDEGALVYDLGEGEDVEVRVLEASGEDYEIPADPRLIGADGTSPATGLVAGMTRSTLDGSCSAVVSYRTGKAEFETCAFSFGKFSPDGRHLVGLPAYGDGAGPRTFSILDARTGEVVVAFDQPRDGRLTLGDPVWEDDTHVLATVTRGLETFVVRFGTDGTVELASPSTPAVDYDVPAPIRFVARP